MIKDNLYCYAFTVTRVIDGDTVVGTVDLGFRTSHEITVRIMGIDAPEMKGPTRQEGLAAKFYLADVAKANFSASRQFYIRTHRDKQTDSFGRWLGDLETADGRSIAEMMIEAGHAKRWAK